MEECRMTIWSTLTADKKSMAIQKHCENGTSATACVHALKANGITGMTRDAVIGHVGRNMKGQWRFGGIFTNKANGVTRADTAKVKRKRGGNNAIGYRAKAKPVRKPIPPAEPVLNSKPVSILMVEAHHCRFPLWNEETQTTKFYCGADKQSGSSYCDYHHSWCHAGTWNPTRNRKAA